MPAPSPSHLAVVELGSNAARFRLVAVRPGVGFTVLREDRAQTRLGAGPGGALPASAVKETLAAVRAFLRSVQGRSPVRVVTVATAAVRDAADAEGLLTALRRESGAEVEVLSGHEEARLAALAAIDTLSMHDGVVADLGGGSLQLARVGDGAVTRTVSLPLGAVRITAELVRHDPPTAAEIAAVRALVQRHGTEIRETAAGGERLVALGGTIRALGRVYLGSGAAASVHRLPLRASHLTTLRERLQSMSLQDRRAVAGLSAERADVVVAGVLVIEELMALGGHDRLVICGEGVSHGLLLRETFERGS